MQDLRKRLRSSLRLAILQLLLTQLLLTERLGVRIQPQQHLPILKWVLLLHASPLRPCLSLGWTYNSLNFGGVNETADIGVVNNVGGE